MLKTHTASMRGVAAGATDREQVVAGEAVSLEGPGGAIYELPQVLTLDEAAAHLRVSAYQLRTWMKLQNDPIPHRRTTTGARAPVLFSRRLIDEWFERQCLGSAASHYELVTFNRGA